ncbi:precorrin-2 dehydrogenase/sirohydrochlorin ferrochelatase family protein [Aquisediminimonas sediminicola]|uniref:precorrin-2 dehydrogenase/sirohydrochlorin ferrochelatase family protein n=1 Tax=Alteraquisediminimonas sediminicola TaxID=2676787 RepID=UPI001C8CFC9A|nr:bifunctional precorrin-2 dehydrogenase/sirohydrochlorin ferrochelatase [Aquisediminimonas sediminicola]
MHSLPVLMRLLGRRVILAGHGAGADAKRRLLTRAGANIVGPDDQAALAIVAIEEEDEALAVIAALKARGVLVNATDRPDHCDFTLPAIIDRHPVLIAIGTGGASAGLAKALRQRLEAMLPANLGKLADGLYAARGAIRRRWPDAATRRRAIDAALDPGGPLDPFHAHQDDAVAAWLDMPETTPRTGLVSLQIDNADPDMLRLWQARLLGQADRVFHHPDVPKAILERARADAERIAATTPPTSSGADLDLWLTYQPVDSSQ